MWLLVNHTKPTNKSATGQLQISRQLQNDSINGAVLITIKRVIMMLITYLIDWLIFKSEKL